MASTMVFLVQVTDYYGYPISRSGITGVYSSVESARESAKKHGAVFTDGRWIIPDPQAEYGEVPSEITIMAFNVDSDERPKEVV